MLRVSYTKLSSGECSSKTLDTKPEWTLLERPVLITTPIRLLVVLIKGRIKLTNEFPQSNTTLFQDNLVLIIN